MFQVFAKPAVRTKRILHIGFVTQDSKAGEQLRNFFQERDAVELKLIESRSVTAKAKPRGIAVFVYDLDSTSEAALQEFDRFMRDRPAEVPVIVLSPSLEDELVRRFLRLRVADWLKSPLSPGELVAACGRVISSHSVGTKQDSRSLTFMGARGGVGTTTLAIHAALILAGNSPIPVPTCLVDLDLVQGACADYMDLRANWQLDELIPNPERLDNRILDIMLSVHASGIHVLAAQRPYSDRLDFDADVITRVLDLATQKFQNLVIDLPRHAASWTDSVLLGSDHIYVVTEFTIPGLKAAKRLVAELVERFDGEVKPKVIVNRYSRSIFGSGISTHEAKEILRHSLAGFVSADGKLVREAIDRGVPTTAIKARNAIMSDLAKILQAGLTSGQIAPQGG
jgi:pilus assembly protein CpaE